MSDAQKRTTPYDAQLAIISTAAQGLIRALKGSDASMQVDGYEVTVQRVVILHSITPTPPVTGD